MLRIPKHISITLLCALVFWWVYVGHALLACCDASPLALCPMQVYGEATIVLPLLVAETFARNYQVPPSFAEPSKQA